MPSPRSLVLWSAAALVVACGGGVVAQQMLERASASVNRLAPARATFDPSIASRLGVPAGYRVTLFASGLGQPRMMEVGPDGTVYVTRRNAGDVLALRDGDGDGRAEQVSTFASGLTGVHGIALQGSELVLASSTTIWRTPLAAAAPRAIVSDLPDGGQHPNRMVRVAPDGTLLVSVGSSCNDCAEEDQLQRATLMRFAADGSTREVVANGLRNTIGYDWHPATGALWGMDHGSDFRGDDLQPEELNELRPGLNYGWPICYADRRVDEMTNAPPSRVALRPGQRPSGAEIARTDFCAQTEPAVLTYDAHAAPMALRFTRSTQFPPETRQDAFVAMRGSWNRSTPAGYKVVRLRFGPDGRPLGFEDFLTGFVSPDGSVHYGRPVGLAWAADGALLVSDDSNGAIWRVSWGG